MMMPQPSGAAPAHQQAAPSMQLDPGDQGGQQPVTIDAVMQLLRDEKMRNYRVDIETDTIVEADQQAEKQATTEFITETTKFISAWMPIVQQAPELAPLAGSMLKWASRKFKAGRDMEEDIEKAMDAVSKKLLQPAPPPQPSPDEQIKLEGTKIKTQAEIKKAELDVAATQAAHEHDLRKMDREDQQALVQSAMQPVQPLPMG
jgi:hypothetical protein